MKSTQKAVPGNETASREHLSETMIPQASVSEQPTIGDKRARNWTAIAYPESMPDNWRELLEESHIEFLVSPLHDKDTNGATGELKKPHYHLMLLYQSPHTKEQAQKVFDSVKATRCQQVNSTRGEARYLCHLDNPEKYQYPIDQVIELNGADYSSLIQLPSDRYKCIREMLAFIEENNVLSFAELLNWTSLNHEEWFRALCDSCAYIIRETIKSRCYSLEHNLTGHCPDGWRVPTRPDQRGGEDR